jgi:hypothetical protein
LEQQMEKVRPVRRIALDHLEPEDFLISQWFPVPPPPPRSGPPLTQAEMAAKLNASRAELEAAVAEEMAEEAANSPLPHP